MNAIRAGHLFSCIASLAVLVVVASSTFATPIVTSLAEHGTLVNLQPAIASSASSPQPASPPAPAASQSAALVDETFAYVTRTHEWTAVRTTDATGLLTSSTAAGTTLQPFPSYLNGLEYIQVANEHRTVEDYSIDATFSQPVKAYLFVDNRINGDLDDNTHPNTDDPLLTGQVAWIVNDGWTRVNTGFMPNGQADYLGVDEGATVASADLRTHAPTTALVAGSGNGLNQFMAIYSKTFTAGTHVAFIKKLGITNTDMYGIAIAPIPEPASVLLALVGACAMAALGRRRAA
jgi:PEP-CTERM motif-containing protein